MIGSRTRLVAIVGSPIVQVKSPDNFNRYFVEHGANRAMIPIDLLPGRLADFVAMARGWQNLDGFVVTIPHKTSVAGLIDELTPTAQFLGAANVVKRHADGRLSGDMIDGVGFVSALHTHGFAPTGKTVLLIGAGAAGAAIGHALAACGVATLLVHDLCDARAKTLVARLVEAFPAIAVSAGPVPPRSFDLFVNASSCGMIPDDPVPVTHDILERMPPDGLVADVVTSPVETPLLVLAARRGLRIQTGEEMAKAQLLALGRAMGVIDEAPR